jgi:hypothetical protein
MADLGSSKVFGDLTVTGEITGMSLNIGGEIETVAAVAGQTTVTLNKQLGNIIPEVYIDGYCSIDRIFNFTVTDNNTITLDTPLEMNGNVYIVNKGSV